MKGLDLCEQFYRTYGEPMLREQFATVLPLLAVGLAGSGSECFGYDDGISSDHDFEPGFCLFLPDEDLVDRKTAFALERAYAKLPREFMGYRRAVQNPVGGNRHGVIRISDFLIEKSGTPDAVLSLRDWCELPEQSLAEITNGRLFYDEVGIMTAVRQTLAYLPQDVRLKKLAGRLLMMGQAGQYNYPRCIARGETGAAQLAVFEFVQSAIHAVFLLNQVYLPYYKWSFRALRELPVLAELHQPLEALISLGNTDTLPQQKQEMIEEICLAVERELRAQSLSACPLSEAEAHAYALNDAIKSAELRNLHILYAI